ncbi:hypothetical protein [Streptomyces sp. NPDC006274]|uniref:hypothetical protein n=1 Tax=unclassified Streptomyces TaxID=2593676 RepID=UPI0033BDF719
MIEGRQLTVEIEQHGEWVPVPGIASIEISGDTDALAERLAEVQTTLRRFVEALAPVARAYGERLAELGAALRAAGLLDENARPVRRRDRPAWQSPYGPPRRR